MCKIAFTAIFWYTIFVKEEKVQNNLKTMRCERGDTQQDLAEKVGVSRQTIISMEKGNYTPSVLLALKIANVFTKRVDEIFFIENSKE